jgi:hypothetical protein
MLKLEKVVSHVDYTRQAMTHLSIRLFMVIPHIRVVLEILNMGKKYFGMR